MGDFVIFSHGNAECRLPHEVLAPQGAHLLLPMASAADRMPLFAPGGRVAIDMPFLLSPYSTSILLAR